MGGRSGNVEPGAAPGAISGRRAVQGLAARTPTMGFASQTQGQKHRYDKKHAQDLAIGEQQNLPKQDAHGRCFQSFRPTGVPPQTPAADCGRSTRAESMLGRTAELRAAALCKTLRLKPMGGCKSLSRAASGARRTAHRPPGEPQCPNLPFFVPVKHVPGDDAP